MVRAIALGLLLLSASARAADLDDEAVAAGLASDEVCEAGDETCALEMRQLRAQQLKTDDPSAPMEEVQEEQPSAADEAFGDEAQGVDLWQEATWGDLVAALQQNVSDEGYGGCDSMTGGTCSLFSCSDSRGATRCMHGKCQCEKGWCAKGGACYPKNPSYCTENTGGTCSVGFCKSSRGATKCKSGQCICKTGGCAHSGRCFPVTDTGGSCSIMGCSSSRGPTTCHRGRCLCRSGFVAVDGGCQRMDD